jgi:hypothetical protein
MVKGKGWKNEPLRHSLARKGVKTGRKVRPRSQRRDFPKGTGLNIHTAIYVPSTREGDKPITRRQHLKRAKEVEMFLANMFGGYTEIETRGGWVSEEKGLIKEPIIVVHAYTDRKTYNKNDELIQDFITTKKKRWGQEAISFEYEESLHFV